MNRAEHLQWCKDRAIAILDDGDITQAFVSMISDMMKHEETANPILTEVGLMYAQNQNAHELRKWITGFN